MDINDLIEKQNKEMLRVLIEEQEADNRRHEELKQTSKDMKSKVLKDLNMERAKAQAKIQKLE